MKKIFAIALVFFAACLHTSAQKKISTYVAGHFGLASAKSSTSGATGRFSTGIGLEFELPLAKKISLAAAPTLNFRGYNNSAFNLKATYIDLPLTLEVVYFHVEELNLYVGAGAYAGIAIAGKYQNTGADWTKLKFGESAADNRSTTDLGLNFTTGLHFNKLKAGFQYQQGLKNVVPKDRQVNGASIKLNNFSGFLAVKLSAFNKKRR